MRWSVGLAGFAVLSLLLCVLAEASEPGRDLFMSGARKLTSRGRRSGECYFSPDGSRLVFMSEREPGNPFFQIYQMDLSTGEVRRVSTGEGKARAEYQKRQEGKKRRGFWDYDEMYDIFAARPDGTLIKRLTSAMGYDAEGAYSPDGSKIVFCSLRDAFPLENRAAVQRAIYERDPSFFGEIYIMNADGTDQKRLTDWPGYDGGPFFTPDGDRIVWRHFSEDGRKADIYTMRTDGSDRRRLTDFGAMSWAPYFHPSGKYCIFTSNKVGYQNFELFIVDASGGRQPVRVTHTDGFDGLASFSPDGSRICWTSNRAGHGRSEVFVAEWDHQGALDAIRHSSEGP